jgi:hypothetical protein
MNEYLLLRSSNPGNEGGCSSSGDLSEPYPWSLRAAGSTVEEGGNGWRRSSTSFRLFLGIACSPSLLLPLQHWACRSLCLESKWFGRDPQNLLRSFGPTPPLQGTRMHSTLGGRILLPLHRFPWDWVRRPVNPFSECLLTLEPIPESIFNDCRSWRWWRRLGRRGDAAWLPEVTSWRPLRLLLEGRLRRSFKRTKLELRFSRSVASSHDDNDWPLISSKRSPETQLNVF